MFTEIYCVVGGRVQGVGYRDTIERYVREHDLFGWIRNKEDGSVEMLVQGAPDDLKVCIEVINQGSPLSRIESMSVDWRTPDVHYDDFKVLSS